MSTMSDEVKRYGVWVRAYDFDRVLAERDEARRRLEWYTSRLHTCSDVCDRPMCVLRRERDALTKRVGELEGAVKDISIIARGATIGFAREACVDIAEQCAAALSPAASDDVAHCADCGQELELVRQAAEIERLREALRNYGWHSVSCSWRPARVAQDFGMVCFCGLDAALAGGATKGGEK